MGIEIERKFLVKNDDWKAMADDGKYCCQGYLAKGKKSMLRVRIMGEQGYLTVKGKQQGISRAEFEYEIPKADAEALLALSESNIIKKRRYLIQHEGHVWELDCFEAENEGLIVAEIELNAEDEAFQSPSWLGKEVSDKSKYNNRSLSKKPFSEW